jgi:nucleotide-binding universal stress UspA family protein
VAGVVVGVAGADRPRAAVRWAGVEAAQRGADLRMVHAWSVPVAVSLPRLVLPDVPVAVTSTAAPGQPAEVLLGCAPDLLVLGGRSGSAHVSRVTRACLRRAECPVVVVPETGAAPSTGRVVVAVCGSRASQNALRWAVGHAELRGTDLVVAHVRQPPLVSSHLLPRSPRTAAPGRAAEDRLRSWVQAGIGRRDVEIVLTQGPPLEGLLELGEAADLLVVGRSRVPVGVGRVLHGALGNDVSGLAPCPVAVVPFGG